MLADALLRVRSFCGFCDWAGGVCLRLQVERELHLILQKPFQGISGVFKALRNLQNALSSQMYHTALSKTDCTYTWGHLWDRLRQNHILRILLIAGGRLRATCE